MISHPSLTIIVGKCRAGKSHLLKYLLYELGCSTKIDMVHLFSRSALSSASDNVNQYDYIPEQWQHHDFQLSSIKNIIKIQRRALRVHGKAPKTVIIYDDGFAKKNQSEDFLKIINSYRHLNISVIVSLQYLASNISTNFREIADNCFIFKADTGSSIKANHEAFFTSVGRNLFEYEKLNARLPQYHCFYVKKDEGKLEIVIAPAELPNYEYIYRQKINL